MNKSCQNCKKAFDIKPDETDFYTKISVPEPTFCPDCRFQRRLMRRNERVLYPRTCSGSGKKIISYYDENVSFPVYSREFWYSDDWDGTTHGRDYDFSKSFFEQLSELSKVAPRLQLWQVNAINSEYSNYIVDSKNCYLCFTALGGNEDSMYSSYLTGSISCLDCDHITKCDRCYECFNCDACYACRFCVDSTNSRDSWFLADCYNCSDCFGCVGLKDKQYCIWNEQYSKEEYKNKISEFKVTARQNIPAFIDKLERMRARFPKRFMHGRKNQEVVGDYVSNSSNSTEAFFVNNCEDTKYVFFTLGLKNAMDVSVLVGGGELIYECHATPRQNYNIRFSDLISNGSTNAEYSSNCDSCSNIFGCIGLRKKEFCILNKQYSKEEYEELLPKVKAHVSQMPFTDAGGRVYAYGEFLPPELSPFAYNESLAQEYFPMTKKEAEEKGFPWKDLKEKNYTLTMAAYAVPDDVSAITEAVTKEVIGCMNEGEGNHNCATAFRIMPDELTFYLQNKIPLPRYCPNCRHHNRLKYRNQLILRERSCDCAGDSSKNGEYQNQSAHTHGAGTCGATFQTTYTDKDPIVYCESCYQQEVM